MKKLVLVLMVSVLCVQLSLSSVFAETSTKIENINYNASENFNLEIKDSALKTIFTTYNENGILDSSEYNKLSKKVYLNGIEVKYSFQEDDKLTTETVTYANPPINSSEAWKPVTVAKGLHIDFSPLINCAGNIASQLLLAQCGVTAASLLSKLVKTTLSSFWTNTINVIGGNIIGAAGGTSANIIVNVNFYYDLQNTKGMVYLGTTGTVPVVASRYANYRTTVKVLGKSISHKTGLKGNWWSSSKPFSLNF